VAGWPGRAGAAPTCRILRQFGPACKAGRAFASAGGEPGKSLRYGKILGRLRLRAGLAGESAPASLCYRVERAGKFPKRPNRELNQPNREPNPPNRNALRNREDAAMNRLDLQFRVRRPDLVYSDGPAGVCHYSPQR
jgi:hypothetical protein